MDRIYESVTETKVRLCVSPSDITMAQDCDVLWSKEFTVEDKVWQLSIGSTHNPSTFGLDIKLKLKSNQAVKVFHQISLIDTQLKNSSERVFEALPNTDILLMSMSVDDSMMSLNGNNNNNLIFAIILRQYEEVPHKYAQYQHINGFNNRLNDLQIICGQTVFSVSKTLLSQKSDTFKTMFEDEIGERRTTSHLLIEDVDQSIVEEFLKFMHSWDMTKLNEFREDLLYMSCKYSVLELTNICSELIFLEINTSNAINMYSMFKRYNCLQTIEKVVEYIANNLVKIRKESEGDWLQMMQNQTQTANLIMGRALANPFPLHDDRLMTYTFNYII